MSRQAKEPKITIRSLFIWLLAVLFFFYEFFLRVLPATVAKHIVVSIDVSIEQFALIGSAYYLTYSLMQFPVGVLLDKFSARLWITIAVMTCAFGAIWFSFAHSFIPAFIARLFIGFGSSFGFISLTVATLNWFPKKYFAFLVGCGQFIGALGPLCAGAPIALMMEATKGDWRLIFLWVALFGICLGLLIGFFFKDKPKKEQKIVFIDKKGPLKKRLVELLRRPQIWWILLFSGSIYVAIPLLGAFWGTSYLETRGFSTLSAAFIISMIWVGLAIGSPLFGRLSDLMKRRRPLMILCAIVGLISSILILWTPSTNFYYLCFLFFLVGLGSSGMNMAFAIITEHSPKSLQATAIGLNNTALMGAGAIIPPFVTSIIRNFTNGEGLTELAFEKGFAVIPIFFTLSLLLTLFAIRETFCRQQLEVHHI
ncbi:MAG: MFS transporter [Simkaniaceae bacterium]|nr:MFS transporter [Candidatus Sacchlamyda saccharinae]